MNSKKVNRKQSASTRQMVWGLVVMISLILILYFAGPYIRRMRRHSGPVHFPIGTIRGIDVSHYQGEIDWEKVADASLDGEHVSFAFIKATEGKTILDEYFVYNFSSARKNGIIRGAYHVFSSKSTAQEQAEFFCNVVELKKRDLYPVLDIEGLGTYTPDQLREGIIDWMNIVEKHFGVTPILYTSYKFKIDYLNGHEFDKYPYWIAHYYVDKLKYKGQWDFWQHTDKGSIDGIEGDVDVDLFNGTYSDLLCLTMGSDHPRFLWTNYLH